MTAAWGAVSASLVTHDHPHQKYRHHQAEHEHEHAGDLRAWVVVDGIGGRSASVIVQAHVVDPGRQRVGLVLDAIFYLCRGGIAWAQLPADFPPYSGARSA
ncbi:transposase [Nocardia fusca]|uniref:transposase n=1 Tax=Nocardia fusca TaxID=941183 RepID=UPI0018DD2A13|nr:transposase [Nocardia fusca]